MTEQPPPNRNQTPEESGVPPSDPSIQMEVHDASDVTQVGTVGGDMVTHRETITDIDTGPVTFNIGTSVIGGVLVLVALIAVLLIGSALINPAPGEPDVTPTLTPADIYIAELDTTNAPADSQFAMANRLEQDLSERLWQHGLSDLSVQIVPALSNANEARGLAQAGGARILIWGWQDAGGISIRVFMVGEDVQEVPATGILPVRGLGTPEAELAFDIAGEIPQNVSFLSLFVIGRLHYENNEYADGYAAYDAAMWSMPDNVRLENRALLHFFTARSMEAGEEPNFDRIVCEYAQAIRHDRKFWEAYVNLANILARREDTMGYVVLSAEAEDCLRLVDPDGYPTAHNLYRIVLEANPDWAIVRYNSLLMSWDWFGRAEDLQEGFEQVLADDPSIVGAHLALGGLAVQTGDDEAARQHFMDALELAPEQVELHVNLGQLHLRAGEVQAARDAFTTALAIAPENGEANLALANLLIMEGERDAAQRYLTAAQEAPPDPQRTWASELPRDVAEVLALRLLVEAGDIEAATEQLVMSLSRSEYSPNLSDYLLGLFHTYSGETELAAQTFEMAWPNSYPDPYAEKDTLSDTWVALSELCVRDMPGGGGGGRYGAYYDPLRRDPDDYRMAEIAEIFAVQYPGVAAWGTSANACLPLALTDRMLAVFDILQAQILNRFYYTFIPPDPGGMACPYVYTYDAERGAWTFDTTILYTLDGPAQAGMQARRLTRFDGRLRILELEPETTYLDALALRVVDGAGRVHWLAAPEPLLQAADGSALILHYGDQIALDFPAFAALEEVRSVWVVATGYYVPDR